MKERTEGCYTGADNDDDDEVLQYYFLLTEQSRNKNDKISILEGHGEVAPTQLLISISSQIERFLNEKLLGMRDIYEQLRASHIACDNVTVWRRGWL